MIKNYPGEEWKAVNFDFDFTNDFKMEISNFGRLRTYNKVSDGDIIQGTMVNGYRIVRLKFYKQRSKKDQQELDKMQSEILEISAGLRKLKKNNERKTKIAEIEKLLSHAKKQLSKKFSTDLKKRTINYHGLIHRLVAEYFLPKPSADEVVVAHLDYNKLNNRLNNLKWMTKQENLKHQQNSPNVIKEKQERKLKNKVNITTAKLTVTKVMLLKKMLNQGKPMKQLVKYFKVTETQILRIKRGENWSQIPAAV